MNDETEQAIVPEDQFGLRFPQLDRAFVQDVEQSVILNRCYRKLQHVSDKKRHHCTAATWLGIQRRYVGKRHIICKIERVVPFRFTVEHSRAEACRAEFASILINDFGAAQKLLLVVKEPAVVVQILDNDFKSAALYGLQQILGDFIALFRDHSESRFDSESLVQIHERRAKISACFGFHVVRHRQAATCAVGPKPHEGNLFEPPGFHGHQQDRFEDVLNCCVDGPLRKSAPLPVARMKLLNLSANRLIRERPQVVIPSLAKPGKTTFLTFCLAVAFQAKIVDDFLQVERQKKSRVFNLDFAGDIVKRRFGPRSNDSGARAAVADAILTEAKKAGIGGQLLAGGDIYKVLGTAITLNHCFTRWNLNP